MDPFELTIDAACSIAVANVFPTAKIESREKLPSQFELIGRISRP
jgi:hypothetical protein